MSISQHRRESSVLDVTLTSEAFEAFGDVGDGLLGRVHLGDRHHQPKEEPIGVGDEAAVVEAHLTGEVHHEDGAASGLGFHLENGR